MRALRVFFPQILLAAIGTTSWTLMTAAWGHPVAMVPLGIVGGLTSALSFFTAVNKAMDISSERDWEMLDWARYKDRGCAECMHLQRRLDAVGKDREELRQAIAVLKVPE